MDIDHMLNGRGSRQHHQNMIKKAQHNRLIAEASHYQNAKTNVLENEEQPKRKAVVQQVKRIVLATAQLLVK